MKSIARLIVTAGCFLTGCGITVTETTDPQAAPHLEHSVVFSGEPVIAHGAKNLVAISASGEEIQLPMLNDGAFASPAGRSEPIEVFSIKNGGNGDSASVGTLTVVDPELSAVIIRTANGQSSIPVRVNGEDYDLTFTNGEALVVGADPAIDEIAAFENPLSVQIQ